jgi:hypothetical protein
MIKSAPAIERIATISYVIRTKDLPLALIRDKERRQSDSPSVNTAMPTHESA